MQMHAHACVVSACCCRNVSCPGIPRLFLACTRRVQCRVVPARPCAVKRGCVPAPASRAQGAPRPVPTLASTRLGWATCRGRAARLRSRTQPWPRQRLLLRSRARPHVWMWVGLGAWLRRRNSYSTEDEDGRAQRSGLCVPAGAGAVVCTPLADLRSSLAADVAAVCLRVRACGGWSAVWLWR